MERLSEIRIRRFKSDDQTQVRELILNGLLAHWGFLDPTKNPDLKNIESSYQEGTFLVAVQDSIILGCGAIIRVSDTCAQIVRMSIQESYRRQGIGTLVLDSLVETARIQGLSKIILETSSTWQDAISFYLKSGFEVTHQQDGDTYFSREL